MRSNDRLPSPSHDHRSTGVPEAKRRLSAGQVLVVTSVMFTFISYWRTAAIVLCDLASTAFYIGGIVEAAIGKAAPWFILAVMIFSYAVRSVYIESCSMFVRGGVYRVVKEAMGGVPAKLSVSALMFDYVLTGPISGVSAGQYLIGLVNETLAHYRISLAIPPGWGSAAIAAAITLYFWRANIRGIRESSDKALKIMGATTVMGVVMLIWCTVTLAVRPGERQLPPMAPDLSKRVDAEGQPQINQVTGRQEDPLGWLGETAVGASLRDPARVLWFSLIGALGIIIAFGHSVLAMSGEETLAQVYREVESPKLPNFKKAAFIVFLYSLFLTSLISFFAVMIIPDEVRLDVYKDNLIGGLAMNVVGPKLARLALHALVVIVGFLILAGAVNTAIVGSNGVLNRVAEDDVLPEWFLRPHPRYGTTSRILTLVVGLQLFTILVSRGDVIVLGEAYAFGVVWSFVFKALAMLILRFRKPEPRTFEVPLNVRLGRYDVPIGISLIFFVLLAAAVTNVFTKPVSTISGGIFTATCFAVFLGSERHHRRRGSAEGAHEEHLEQFNEQMSEQVTPEALALTKPHRKLVAVRSPHNLAMLKTCLDETDPETTEVVVLVADVVPLRAVAPTPGVSKVDRELLTAVVSLAETEGKSVRPLIVQTNDPLGTVARIARTIGAQEVFLGPSYRLRTEAEIDRVARRWTGKSSGTPAPLTIRVVGQNLSARRDIAGGSRIPQAGKPGSKGK
jgi:amino acid transporter